VLTLSACQTDAGGPLRLETGAASPVAALQTINESGRKCWIKSNDRRFHGLTMVPEFDTTAGNPRILVLPFGQADGLPALVIEASGEPVTIETYGPLAASAAGAHINRDIARWMGGGLTCR
jgi:hypothetical protein